MIKYFKELLPNTQYAMHSVAIYSGMLEILTHRNCNKKYISYEQLHAMVLCIYHYINVLVEGLDGEHISEMCQWVGSTAGAEGIDGTTGCGYSITCAGVVAR